MTSGRFIVWDASGSDSQRGRSCARLLGHVLSYTGAQYPRMVAGHGPREHAMLTSRAQEEQEAPTVEGTSTSPHWKPAAALF